ncbi:MAG: V-type ATP synthase subunit E [Candidatus Caldarchaeum sp.]
MSTTLAKVVNEVLQEALAKALKSVDEAEAEALRIVSKAEEDVLAEVRTIQEAGRKAREAEVQRILSTAEIQAKNLAIAAVEEEVTKIFEAVLEKVVEESKHSEFKPVMAKLLDEVVELLGRDLMVESNEVGLAMLREIVKSKKYPVKVFVAEVPVNIKAGVRAVSLDGAIRYDNSLEARLERLKPYLRTKLAKMLLPKE